MRRCLSQQRARQLVHALVISRSDECYSLLVDLLTRATSSTTCTQCLIQNGILGRGKYQHVTAMLRELHWLLIKSRIQYKTTVTHIWKCLDDLGSKYLCDLIDCYVPRHGDFGLLESYSFVDPWCGPPLENVHYHMIILLLLSGIHSHCGSAHAPALRILRYH